MKSATPALRRMDLVVLIACAGFVIIAAAVLSREGRERAKRAVCLANLKQLMSAWTLYAEQNDGKIVSGTAGVHYTKTGEVYDANAVGIVERAWVGRTWSRNWNNRNVANTGLTEAQKWDTIHEGALWSLLGEERCYKCPVGKSYEWVTYAIVDAMNGNHRLGTYRLSQDPLEQWHPNAVGEKVGETVLWIKKRNEIVSPPPVQRMVFIDEGAATPDSFWVDYNWHAWRDTPAVRHNNGTTVSWADGHVTEYKWIASETVEYGRRFTDYYGGSSFTPQTAEGLEDLKDLQRAVWGRVGY